MEEIKKKFLQLQGLDRLAYGINVLCMGCVVLFFVLEVTGFWPEAYLVYSPAAAVLMLTQADLDRNNKKKGSLIFCLIAGILLAVVSALLFIFL